MNAPHTRKEALLARFSELSADNGPVAQAYAQLQAAFATNSNGPEAFWAKVELGEALKNARVPERDAKDMTSLVVEQQLGRSR